MRYKIGTIQEGTITGLQPYGAFVSLGDNVQGLIHVSEIQVGYTKNINSILNVGDKVNVQIIDIDEYSKKISLSLRTLKSVPQPSGFKRKKYFTNKNKKIGFATLEKKLPQWIEMALDDLSLK
ncbi:CvfD/Ygs/GSP13 family RNA-binding post-transcriptional regulator [Enterococcus larvae]|uniref:CvfD/Ygs/GSP13 family RNA-binding post-transcriptional regulator n=1 Tax=Enterococcus larvae TaxID=2794352 RepID=UPI003F308E8D